MKRAKPEVYMKHVYLVSACALVVPCVLDITTTPDKGKRLGMITSLMQAFIQHCEHCCPGYLFPFILHAYTDGVSVLWPWAKLNFRCNGQAGNCLIRSYLYPDPSEALHVSFDGIILHHARQQRAISLHQVQVL
jgi:hypothetical protein